MEKKIGAAIGMSLVVAFALVWVVVLVAVVHGLWQLYGLVWGLT